MSIESLTATPSIPLTAEVSPLLPLAFAMQPGLLPRIMSTRLLEDLAAVARFDATRAIDDFEVKDPAELEAIEVLVTGWGCPPLTGRVLAGMPRLRAVVHAAGSVKPHLPDEFWTRDIGVSSAADANAIPVAEFTLAAILFSNKGVLRIADDYRSQRIVEGVDAQYPGIGNYGKRIGVVGASRIGRRVIELLAPFALEVVVADPYLNAAEAHAMGTTLLSLDELVTTSDVVTLHAPELPQTRHLMNARRLASMKRGATLINTARGALVDHDALLEALMSGRINAVIDVTTPELLPAQSPLFQLPNVLVTPHIAGSLGMELMRLGEAAVTEVTRLARGQPLLHPVDRSSLQRTA